MLRPPLEITLLRGRTEPDEAGREAAVDVLLDVEVGVLMEEVLPLVDGFVPDGLAPEVGLELVDGVLVFGAVGVSDAGGTFACATGSPPL